MYRIINKFNNVRYCKTTIRHGLIAMLMSIGLSGCASLNVWDQSWFEADQDMNAEQKQVIQVVNVREMQQMQQQQMQMKLNTQVVDNALTTDNFGSLTQTPVYANNRGLYRGHALTKHVGHYVQSMAHQLIANMEYLTDKTPVGVTTFSPVDSELQKTNLLGFQIAESFMHELHKFRIPVIDFKATDYIRVTNQGDFLLSRDFLELKNRVEIEYILTGTMTRHQGGMLVNARILGMGSKAVVASAQMMIPFYVVDALLPTDGALQDGVSLSRGE